MWVTSSALRVSESKENNFVPSFSSDAIYLSKYEVRSPYGPSLGGIEPLCPRISGVISGGGIPDPSKLIPLRSSRERFDCRYHDAVVWRCLFLSVEVRKQKSEGAHRPQDRFFGLTHQAAAERLGLENPVKIRYQGYECEKDTGTTHRGER